MLQADGDNLRLGRGEVYFDRFSSGASTGERFLGNVTALSLTTSDEVIDKYSSVEASSPLLKSVKIRRTVEVTLTMDEFKMENIALALSGTVAVGTQAAAAAQTISFANVKKGRAYSIGKFNVSNVVVEVAAVAKVLGTDYELDTTWGLIYIIPGGSIADNATVDVDYDCASITAYNTLKGGDADIEGKLRYVSDNSAGSNDMLVIPKMQIVPEGETGFISDEFGNMTIKGKILSVAGQDLYNLYRLTGD